VIVKLTLEDAIAVAKDMRDDDQLAIRALMGSLAPEVFAASRWQTEGPAWTLYQGDEPVAIFGLSQHCAWAATAWLVARPGITGESWRKLLRHCRTVAANLKGSPLHRVEALVMEDWPAAARFAARLGFRHEGTKTAAGRRRENVEVWSLTA
jgi:hypothetical protein